MDMLRRGEYETTSVISEEDSTTDSGRGGSEEGDHGHLNAGNFQLLPPKTHHPTNLKHINSQLALFSETCFFFEAESCIVILSLLRKVIITQKQFSCYEV